MGVGEAFATQHDGDIRGLEAVRVLCDEILLVQELRNKKAGQSYSMSHDCTLRESILQEL